MATEPSFQIPVQPERRYPRAGGVEYEGETTFELRPQSAKSEGELQSTVTDVFEAGPYRYGDFLELPMAVWLVRDDDTADVFRLSIRDGAVRLHVLPATESPGLQRFYERLGEKTDCGWRVRCESQRR
jgi:hypothetical protein